jgi:hypothetical protein
MDDATRAQRYRQRRKAGAQAGLAKFPTMKAADRELRFQDALCATLPPVRPASPDWFRRQRKEPLEITLKRTTHYA